MIEGEPIQQPEDPRKPLSEAIVKILEGYNSLCMDDPLDRQRLADVLSAAIWEAEWRMENGIDENIEDPTRGYEPDDLYGL
jgi:hypothetical protein